MSFSVTEGNMVDFAPYLPAILSQTRLESCREIYEQNRHRVYSLAFWMSDNELAAEAFLTQTFCRAFAVCETPTVDEIDRALMSELRECFALGTLTLNCAPCDRVLSVRENTLRTDLERAVVQLPATEKMMFLLHDVEGYSHSRVASLLSVSEDAVRLGVHQARLRVRELLAN